jgi:hypothetical protein
MWRLKKEPPINNSNILTFDNETTDRRLRKNNKFKIVTPGTLFKEKKERYGR